MNEFHHRVELLAAIISFHVAMICAFLFGSEIDNEPEGIMQKVIVPSIFVLIFIRVIMVLELDLGSQLRIWIGIVRGGIAGLSIAFTFYYVFLALRG